MKKKISSFLFKIVRAMVWLCYPKILVEGAENLPGKASIIVANHAQMHGPLACEFYLPGKRRIWCAGEMMSFKEVPSYAYRDFWSRKPALTRPFYKLLSYIITPLAVLIFNNAYTIGVYHDSRILTTFKTTVTHLRDGANVVIFPEHDVECNNILYELQDRFIDIAKMYHKRTGEELSFVPMYIAPSLKKMYIGKPVSFDAGAPIETERARIRDYLADAICSIAYSLPEHRVVPYRNVPKSEYPINIPEVSEIEKARG